MLCTSLTSTACGGRTSIAVVNVTKNTQFLLQKIALLYNRDMDINNIYFGVCYWDSNKDEFVPFNIFDAGRTRYWLAKYRVHPIQFRRLSIFSFVFNDFCGRCQWEWIVSNWPKNDKEQKLDVWTAYLIPNKEYLTKLMNSVSVASCKRYLKKYGK